ncbi:MAG: ankyrin repeat domain-containing protein, partial [Acidobacteriota bacterium]
EQGADPNAADKKGTTALHYAVQKGISSLTRLEESYYNSYLYRPNMLILVKALLDQGADPNPRLVEAVRFTGTTVLTDLGGVTPFVLAAAVNDVSVMRLLAAGGADPLTITGDHTTALMVAAGLGRTSDRTDDEEVRTALESVKLAVELGADVNATNDRGQTALQGAARVGLNPLIQFLVDEGAEIDVKDNFGQTALSLASGVIPATDLMAKNWNHKPFGVHESSAKLLRELGATPLPVAETVYAAGK